MNKRPPGFWRLALGAWALLLCSNGLASADLQEQVKAGFLLNFAKFIEWPADQFDDQNSPLILCVLGDAERAQTVQNVLKNRKIGQRSVQVWYRELGDTTDCQIAFISNSSRAKTEMLLGGFKGSSTLTVYEMEDEIVGGIIRLFIQDRKIRFSIDSAEAAKADLKISSKLMRVAIQRTP